MDGENITISDIGRRRIIILQTLQNNIRDYLNLCDSSNDFMENCSEYEYVNLYLKTYWLIYSRDPENIPIDIDKYTNKYSYTDEYK